MKLSDIMSAMRLEAFAEVGLVIFFIAFIAVVVRLYVTKREERTYEKARFMPLNDDEPLDPRGAPPADRDLAEESN